jgi:hypothetical protein
MVRRQEHGDRISIACFNVQQGERSANRCSAIAGLYEDVACGEPLQRTSPPFSVLGSDD